MNSTITGTYQSWTQQFLHLVLLCSPVFLLEGERQPIPMFHLERLFLKIWDGFDPLCLERHHGLQYSGCCLILHPGHCSPKHVTSRKELKMLVLTPNCAGMKLLWFCNFFKWTNIKNLDWQSALLPFFYLKVGAFCAGISKCRTEML